VVAVVLALGLGGPFLGACGPVGLDRDGARAFTGDALRHAGLRRVDVRGTVTACDVDDAAGWRTTARTEVGDVSLCVSRSQGRALSVRDPGLSDAQFARLERYRSESSADRARPLATASAVLLLLGVLIQLSLRLRPLRDRPS
jgi:hypothetical protein